MTLPENKDQMIKRLRERNPALLSIRAENGKVRGYCGVLVPKIICQEVKMEEVAGSSISYQYHEQGGWATAC